MAKWGEGDPRWIVEERPDATNVNNWHWTERDASTWSKDRLKELLLGVKVQDEQGECEITEVSSIVGEATANNRKAKLIFFYEWDIKLEWKGFLNDDNKDLKGTIHIPNLSDENAVGDVDIVVSVKKHTKESTLLRVLLNTRGVVLIRQQLQDYLDGLQREFSQGMILPQGKSSSPAILPANSETKSLSTSSKIVLSPSASKDSTTMNNMKNLNIGTKMETQKLTMTEEFKCCANDMYETLTNPQRVQAFTRAPVTLELKSGGKFSLLAGNITGEFVSLEQDKKIVQKWRHKTWPEGHFSTATIELTQKTDCTELKLTQTGVPKSEYEKTKHGWKNYYWRSISTIFGYGSSLF